MKEKILCIAGMHRSGTSLVANWFQENGLHIGNELLGSASSNPKGHFEDLDFLNFHQEVFHSYGCHKSGLIIDGAEPGFLDIQVESAKKLIERKCQSQKKWGWKEPRSTYYLLEWKKIIPELKIFAVYRNPAEVIQSLYKRLKKNKWYYTRNPVKKIYWYMDIDMRPGKWYGKFEKTYIAYNHEILKFREKYPEDILLFDIEDIKSNDLKIIELTNQKFDLKLKNKPLSIIYEERFMTSSTSNFSGFQIKNAENYYLKLKSMATQI